MTVTIEQMVQREVDICLSSLVSTLAGGGGRSPRELGRELAELCDQAFELASPIDDWEKAAVQEGWNALYGVWRHREAHEGSTRSPKSRGYTDVRELCEVNEIKPYQREVYEHWAVSMWLAEKLASHGEKVDTDFAGMNVWARTTTEQAIASDSVIQRIYAEMTTPHTFTVYDSQDSSWFRDGLTRADAIALCAERNRENSRFGDRYMIKED